MSEEQLQALLAAMEKDEDLKSRISSASSYEEIVNEAEKNGYQIEIADLLSLDSEISDRELQDVSGGMRMADGGKTPSQTNAASTYCCCGCLTNFSLKPGK